MLRFAVAARRFAPRAARFGPAATARNASSAPGCGFQSVADLVDSEPSLRIIVTFNDVSMVNWRTIWGPYPGLESEYPLAGVVAKMSTPSYARAGAQPGQASMDSTVGGTCPGACHTSGIAIPEVTPEVRAATTRFYQNLGEDFIPGLGSIKLPRGGYLFSGDEASRVGGLLASAPFVGFALKRVAIIPKVTNPKLANLVNDLYKGARGPNTIGTGSTADAIRNELATGLPTHGVFHSKLAAQEPEC